MKDESPRIFRNLEKTAGRDGFDTIVGAAVASYGSLRLPNDTQVRDFGRLVDPLWTKITPETRRSVAAALSNSSRVPRAIVARLVAEPIEISAPFLMSSPVLEPADLDVLKASPDSRMQRIVEGRNPIAPAAPAFMTEPVADEPVALAPPSAAVPAAAKAAPVTASAAAPVATSAAAPAATSAAAPAATSAAAPVATSAALRPAAAAPSLAPSSHPASPVEATPAPPLLRARSAPVATPPAPSATRADLVRETLRRLALAGRQAGPTLDPAPKLEDLVALAVQQDADRFYTGLRRKLMLPMDMLGKIVEDETGDRLAVALKAMNAGAADALTILMMMKPRIGLDVEAFGRMTKYYRALKVEDCASLTGAALRRQTVAAPSLEPQYQDLEPLERQAPRPIFGRRASRPGETDKGSKRA